MRLIDADKLKEELSYKSPAPDFGIDGVILGVIDEQPTVNPWHRVEDELPEIGHSILIWAGGVALIGKRTDDDMFKGKRYFLIEANGYNYWERVEPGMYWMPMPEPPNEDA